MVKYATIFVLFLSVTTSGYAQTVDSIATFPYFFLGKWEVVILNNKGDTVQFAKVDCQKTLNGQALKSDYYACNRKGEIYFSGTTIRTYVPSINSWVVHWCMANLPGYTYLTEKYTAGELRANGHGEDGKGKFLERYKYFDFSENRYKFQLKRSYDQGRTWQSHNVLHAVRSELK